MTEVLAEAAQVLLPFVVGGVGAVAAGTAEEAGAELYRSASSLAERVRRRLTRRAAATDDRETSEAAAADVRVVQVALQEGLADGDISSSELERLVRLAQASGPVTNINSIQAKNVLTNPTIGVFNA